MIFPRLFKFKQGVNIELFIVNIIEEEKGSISARVLRGLLYMLSILYKVAVSFKNLLYLRAILKEKNAELPTLCVGNIVAGGVGKTPFVEMLIRDLKKMKVAVISRGYRSIGSTKKDVLIASDPRYCGDEACLIQKNAPESLVLVSKNKRLAINVAKEKGAQIAILDDGMQSRALKKEMLITLINAKNPFGNGYHLPRGYLRESPKELKRADYICVTNAEDKQKYEQLVKELKKFSSAKTIGGKKKASKVCGQKNYKLEEIQGKRVGAFCGLGEPRQFFEMLGDLKVDLIEAKTLGDHEKFEDKALWDFSARCKKKGAELILCTEKDYVKLDPEMSYELPICYVQIIFKIEYGTKDYDALLLSVLELTT